MNIDDKEYSRQAPCSNPSSALREMGSVGKGGVGEKPFEGFAPTGPANQNLTYLLHPLPRWQRQRDRPQSCRGPVGQEEVNKVRLRIAIVRKVGKGGVGEKPFKGFAPTCQD